MFNNHRISGVILMAEANKIDEYSDALKKIDSFINRIKIIAFDKYPDILKEKDLKS